MVGFSELLVDYFDQYVRKNIAFKMANYIKANYVPKSEIAQELQPIRNLVYHGLMDFIADYPRLDKVWTRTQVFMTLDAIQRRLQVLIKKYEGGKKE